MTLRAEALAQTLDIRNWCIAFMERSRQRYGVYPTINWIGSEDGLSLGDLDGGIRRSVLVHPYVKQRPQKVGDSFIAGDYEYNLPQTWRHVINRIQEAPPWTDRPLGRIRIQTYEGGGSRDGDTSWGSQRFDKHGRQNQGWCVQMLLITADRGRLLCTVKGRDPLDIYTNGAVAYNI